MSIIRGARPSDNFVMIQNAALADERLSFKARGLLAYMLSRPPGWTTSAERLAAMAKDGRDSVRTGLRELEEHGYLTRKRTHDEAGKWSHDQYITDEPMTNHGTIDGLSVDGKTDDGFPDDGKAVDTTKTESNKTDSNKTSGTLTSRRA